MLLIVASLVTACDALPSISQITPSKQEQTTPGATETEVASPTPTIPLNTPIEEPTQSDLSSQILALEEYESDAPMQPTPTALPDPLKLVYPTQNAGIVSAWVPPLYPIPWAPTPYDHFYFARPVAADKPNWPTADYRYGSIFFENIIHTGVDIAASVGTPIIAAGPGKVVWVGYGVYRGIDDPSDPYGLTVVIRHDFGYKGETLYTVYGHLSEIEVLEGQQVETGDLVGLAGQTGEVTGPHLHFEVRIGDNTYFTTRNPELWISPPQGHGILVGRVMDSGKRILDNQPFRLFNEVENIWTAKSYGKEAVNRDPYYQENLVIGDLPAGIYDLFTSYAGIRYYAQVQIHPGMVTYFRFTGHYGIEIGLPNPPGSDFTPLPVEASQP